MGKDNTKEVLGQENVAIVQDDYATTRVPAHERRSTTNIAFVTAGFCIAMSGLYTGSALAAGLSFREAIISALIGNLILAIFGGTIGAAGSKEGLSSARLAVYSFGAQGFKIVSFVLALTMAGWFSVQSGLFGHAINAMFPQAVFITEPHVAAVWGGLLMLLTAYFGYKGIEILSYLAVPLITILAIIGVFKSIDSAGGWQSTMEIVPVENITVGAGIVMVVGSFAAGSSAQADIARYAKNPKAAWIGSIVGYLVANTFIIVAGYLTTLCTSLDLPNAMLALGLGFPAVLILILAQWTTNDNNLYTSSLGFANIFKLQRRHWVLLIGIVGSLLAGIGVADYFSSWLSILGIGIPPMAGIIIADYYLVDRTKYSSDLQLPNWNLNALIAWAIASVVGFAVKGGIASINSLIVAILVYTILMKTKLIKFNQE